jgi:predicted nucleotidyltransferase component of viral defense system
MKRKVKNLAASVQSRLLVEAKKSGRPADWIYRNYANERLLYRLSQSEHCQKFVLKGGLTFIGWGIPLRRHTKDIDFRAYTSNNLEDIAQIFKEICVQAVKPDGMEYYAETITAEVITEEAEYPGIRVHLLAKVGETVKLRLQIDMGFSDEIVPSPSIIVYPTILSDMPSPILQGYPKETVISEKFHGIVDRGSLNSRMKDFYDIWFIILQSNIDGTILQDAIMTTFNARETAVPDELPIALSDDFAKGKERQWLAFLNTFNPEISEIFDFTNLIRVLREFFIPIIRAISDGKTFNLRWNAGDRWSVP